MVSTVSFADTNAKIMLQHKGSVKLFDSNKMAEAMEAAVDGDTLFLTEGTFDALAITKKITLRGSGTQTVINGNVNIEIPNSPTMTSPVLDALSVSGNIYVKSDIDGLKLRKCKFNNIHFSAKVDNAIIDRCLATYNVYGSSFINGLTVINSYIGLGSDSKCSNMTFVNCDIKLYNISDVSANFMNCAFYSSYSGSSYVFSGCVFSYCCIPSSYYNSSSSAKNCYNTSEAYGASSETILAKNWIGSDGTVVGKYGGNTPYTLVPAVPKVTESQIKLDTEAKKLNVTLKVTAK